LAVSLAHAPTGGGLLSEIPIHNGGSLQHIAADAFCGFRFAEIVSKYSIHSKTIMKKILLLAALLIGSVSAAWPADHPVTVSDFVFTPSTVNAVVGDTITWTWLNGMHTTSTNSAHIPAGARPWNRPIDSNNTQFRMRVTVAGTYRYRCNFHFRQGMTGMIVVSAASPGQVPATN